jgi:hypothetical protein
MSRGRAHLAVAVLTVALAPWCAAQVRVTFPLQGFYRPGKFMPVRVQSSSATTGPVLLRADGAVGVSVEPGPDGAVNAVVPFLAVTELGAPRWEVGGASGTAAASLTPLQDDQVLVGVVGPDASAAASAAGKLFPGRQVVPVPLSGTPAMSGDPAAWETLDAAVFDDATHVFLAELLQLGVSVVVRSDAPPAGNWAWQGGPGHWFVRHSHAGPRGAIEPEVYQRIAAWRPGWPSPLRRQAALLATVFCIVAVGVTLWRRTRRAAFGVVVVSVVASAGFVWWGTRQPMLCELNARILVTGPGGGQVDDWTHYRPLRRREVSVTRGTGFRFSDKPVFASARHLRQADPLLHVSGSGRPTRFTWNADAGTTLAFLERSFFSGSGGAPGSTRSPPLSPARELAVRCYLQLGDTLSEDPTQPDPEPDAAWSTRWPTVTVQHPSPVTSTPATGTAPATPRG